MILLAVTQSQLDLALYTAVVLAVVGVVGVVRLWNRKPRPFIFRVFVALVAIGVSGVILYGVGLIILAVVDIALSAFTWASQKVDAFLDAILVGR